MGYISEEDDEYWPKPKEDLPKEDLPKPDLPKPKDPHPMADVLVKGDPVFIEAKTTNYVGRVNLLTPTGVWLTDAAVIRLCSLDYFLLNGPMPNSYEAQLVPDALWISLEGVQDITHWRHALPLQEPKVQER